MKTSRRLATVLMIVALMMTTLPVTAAQAAASKVQITWNANGGKIETAKTKTTNATKGKNIGKLQTAKRTGYIPTPPRRLGSTTKTWI